MRGKTTDEEGKEEFVGPLNIQEVTGIFLQEIEKKIFTHSEPTTLKQLLRD